MPDPSPETPTHGLAERLEADAERWDLDHCCSVDVADLRAAVAQLREKDAEIERWKAKATELGEALRLDLKGIVNVMEEVPVERIAELEAQLRQLDRIKAAVGMSDPAQVAESLIESGDLVVPSAVPVAVDLLRRLADALDGDEGVPDGA